MYILNNYCNLEFEMEILLLILFASRLYYYINQTGPSKVHSFIYILCVIVITVR